MGGVWLAGWLALIAAGGWLVAAHGLRQPRGWPRVLGACVVSWAWVTLGMQILGTIGLLGRPALLAWAVAGVASGLACRAARGAVEIAPEGAGRGAWSWSWEATAALGLMIGAWGVLLAPAVLLPPRVVSDGPIYHLYFAAKWWKAGRIFLVPTPFGETAAPYFPANGDLWFSALMAVFGGDRPARIGQSPGLVVGFAATIALSLRLGASLPGAVLASAWASSGSALLVFGFEANVDALFVAGYLVSVYFGVRYALDGGGASNLVLAGLSAGLAWGTKPTALLFIPPLLVLGCAIILLRNGPKGIKAGHAAIFLASALVPSAYWSARSGIVAGNPLYPLHLEAFGRVWLRGWFERSAMSRSRYALEVTDWKALVAILLGVLDPRMAPAWALALLGAWRWGRPSRPIDRWGWGLSALAAANVATYWLLIPYRTQQRFLLQGIGLAAVPLALSVDRGRWLRWLGLALLAVHLVTAQTWPTAPTDGRRPWSFSEKIPSAIPAPVAVPVASVPWWVIASDPSALGSAAALAWLVAGSCASAHLWGLCARGPSPRRRWSAVAATLLTWAGYVSASEALSGASRLVFPAFADYQGGWSAVERASPPSGLRVAYAGTNLPYYLMAGGLRNEVFYVNVDRHRDWLLHDYHLSARDRGDPPLWDTPRPGVGPPASPVLRLAGEPPRPGDRPAGRGPLQPRRRPLQPRRPPGLPRRARVGRLPSRPVHPHFPRIDRPGLEDARIPPGPRPRKSGIRDGSPVQAPLIKV